MAQMRNIGHPARALGARAGQGPHHLAGGTLTVLGARIAATLAEPVQPCRGPAAVARAAAAGCAQLKLSRPARPPGAVGPGGRSHIISQARIGAIPGRPVPH